MDAIVTIDEQRRIRLFNAAAERLLQCSAEDCIGRTLDSVLTPELRQKLERYMRGLAVEGWHGNAIWVPEGSSALRKDGSSFPVEFSLSHTEIEGQHHFTLILRDIDERLAARERIKQLNQEREYLSEEVKHDHNFEELVGSSPAFSAVLRQVSLVTETESTALILGESGTGKELIARAIHARSSRKDRPLGLGQISCGTRLCIR
jgi:PAS domain S-box-containing protein